MGSSRHERGAPWQGYIGRVNRAEAEAAQVEYLLRIKQRLVRVPPGIDIKDFVLNDGRASEPDQVTTSAATLAQYRRQYLESHQNGAMEQNSLATVEIHLDHFASTLDNGFPIQTLALADLQRHVNRRAAKRYRGKPLSPTTLKKEMSSFRTV